MEFFHNEISNHWALRNHTMQMVAVSFLLLETSIFSSSLYSHSLKVFKNAFHCNIPV